MLNHDIAAAAGFARSCAAPLSDGMHAVAAVLNVWDSGEESAPPLREADQVLEQLMRHLDESRNAGAASISAASTIAMALGRIVATIRPRLEQHPVEDAAAQERPSGR